MWKRALADAVLFFVVSYLGTKNQVPLLLLSVIFAGLHALMCRCMKSYEYFDYMPDSHKTTCAKGSVYGDNGLDCKIPSDIYGL